MEKTIKFIHIADVHLDAWREKELKRLNFLAFKKVVDEAISRKVDFLLISGDVLHVSMPSIDAIRFLTRELNKLKKNNIDVFAIPGSHDLNSAETSFLYVLEDADLLKITSNMIIENDSLVLLPTVYKDEVVIYGMLGRAGSLEKEYYKRIKKLKDWEQHKDKFKIFQMHIGVNEIMPKEMQIPQNIPLNTLPKGFDYYASGHIHKTIIKEIRTLDKQGHIVYPGPVYTDNFQELQEMKGRSNYVYVETIFDGKEWKTNIKHESFVLKEVIYKEINVNGLTPKQVEEKTLNIINNDNVSDRIVLIKYLGNVDGLVSNIDFKKLKEEITQKGAYIVKINTSHLSSKFDDSSVYVESRSDIKEIETRFLNEIVESAKGKYSFDVEKVTTLLFNNLSEIKEENETSSTYESRVVGKTFSKIENLIQKEVGNK